MIFNVPPRGAFRSCPNSISQQKATMQESMGGGGSLAFLLHLTAHTPPAWFLICAEGEARLCSTCGAASVGVARRRRVDGAKAAVGVLGGPRDCHGPFDALNDLRCQALDRVLALIDVVIQPFNAAEVRSLVVPTLS